MAKDDYHVLACRLLSYLYACLKNGVQPDNDYLTYNTKTFPVGEEYWEYLLRHLYLGGYIEGVELTQLPGMPQPCIKVVSRMQITPSGIEYLVVPSGERGLKLNLKSQTSANITRTKASYQGAFLIPFRKEVKECK